MQTQPFWGKKITKWPPFFPEKKKIENMVFRKKKPFFSPFWGKNSGKRKEKKKDPKTFGYPPLVNFLKSPNGLKEKLEKKINLGKRNTEKIKRKNGN